MTYPWLVEDIPCPMCGAITSPDRLMSSHSFGSPDLDLRPAPDLGEQIEYLVETCQSCGYSCASLDTPPDGSAREAMATPEWHELREEQGLPALVMDFKRAEFLASRALKPMEALWMALRAVWACDDARPSRSPELRQNMIRRLLEHHQAGGAFTSQAGGDQTLLADLYRRIGAWEPAQAWALKGKEAAVEPIIRAIADYQLHLIQTRDTACHQVEEAAPYL